MSIVTADQQTADAFATSWNHLPVGSVYTTEQFVDWFEPLSREDVEGKRVLELGCGNGSLMTHVAEWHPTYLEGVDLGDSVVTARRNLKDAARVVKADLVEYESDTGKFDLVYCIGVLHHLKNPVDGFEAVLRNVKPGGRFHCWVYGREGNALVRFLVEPLRRVTSRLPWWVTKYLVATPLAVPFYLYARFISLLPSVVDWLPLASYCRWIARRGFSFFRHVAFDQLVTPQTCFLAKQQIEDWLASSPTIDPDSTYVIQRNGNSWKFGGRLASN